MPLSTSTRSPLRSLLLRPGLRRPFLQPMWQSVHRLSLWGMNIGPAGRLEDSSEEWILDWCFRRSPRSRPFVLFDGGANVGDYTKDAIRIAGARLQAYCFEPAPTTFSQLSENLKGQPHVRLLNFGLSDAERVCEIYSHAGGAAEASLVQRDMSHWGVTQDIVQTVQLRRLDDFCRVEGVRHIDLLKLDVEGHELQALQGAEESLSSHRIRFVQFEFGAPDIESRTHFKDLFKLLNPNCRIHRIVHHGLAPIETYSEFHEVYATANYLAVAR